MRRRRPQGHRVELGWQRVADPFAVHALSRELRFAPAPDRVARRILDEAAREVFTVRHRHAVTRYRGGRSRSVRRVRRVTAEAELAVVVATPASVLGAEPVRISRLRALIGPVAP